jgi:hypothetical protein
MKPSHWSKLMEFFSTEAHREEATALMRRFLREFYAADFDIDQFHAVIDDAHEQVANEVP